MKMRNPNCYFIDEDWNKFNYAMGVLSRNKRIFDKAGMDISYLWSKVRQLRKEYGEGRRILVVVDYLQLIVGADRYQQNRQAEISEISRALKQMASETNVVVIALSQLSRGVESRQDKRPMLSDLRDSGQIEQNADVIAFLYREEYYGKRQGEGKAVGAQEKQGLQLVEVIVAKQWNGPIGTVG